MSERTSLRRRAVVMGGAGFLGSHVCETLLGRGHEVVCLDNESTGSDTNVAHLVGTDGFSYRQCDVTEEVDVPGRVDLVLQLASPASPVDYLAMPLETMKVGSLGTMNGLDLAAREHARFVFASTSEVYGDPLEHPQRESYWGNVNPVGPRAVYDESKRFGEALTTAYRTSQGVDTGIVRIFNTYGPRMRTDDGRVVPTFLQQALAGEPLTVAGDGTQTRSLCYVDDTVRGIVAMAESPHSGPVNIGNTHEVTMLELAHHVIELTGSPSRIEFVDRPVDDPEKRRPDTSLARELLDWAPQTDARTGLSRTIEWFSEALEAVGA
ncbi:MAG: SDR family oxidoreductase [Actinomycetota bacterium]|nr:SDR family oxidoreductase [Actinomycetota bacterium]